MNKHRGFTLLELVMVIVITGIIALIVARFIKPAFDSYLDTKRRAGLTDMADTALRRMSQEVRSAVPNSIILHSASCFQFVPTSMGGRYRMDIDSNSANAVAMPLDTNVPVQTFDVLNPMPTVPPAGDWVVVNNQNTNDVYTGANRADIQSTAVPATTAGQLRITLTAAKQFSPGYSGGRFVIVPNATQTIFYTCTGGKLYRSVTPFGITPATCNAGVDVVASNVASCTFQYFPTTVAGQQNGFISLGLTLTDSGESVRLSHGVHVDNLP